MGYGTSPYGLSPYGGSSATMSILAAWAISTHAVRVELSTEPVHESEFNSGDAMNPLSWSVTNTTTGEVMTVVAASMHDSTTVDLFTIDPLGDHLESHDVAAIGLTSIAGLPITSPASASFLGVVTTVDPVDSLRVDFRDRDIANPPFQVARELGYAGTLKYGSDGDLETEAGIPLTRKLVLRRISTPRGAFPHLPTYGVGLLEKEPISAGGDLVEILRDIEDQAKMEPDVISAQARGSASRSGVLVIQLAIRVSGGATVDMRLGPVGGRLVEM